MPLSAICTPYSSVVFCTVPGFLGMPSTYRDYKPTVTFESLEQYCGVDRHLSVSMQAVSGFCWEHALPSDLATWLSKGHIYSAGTASLR